jgi:hypothetical protein
VTGGRNSPNNGRRNCANCAASEQNKNVPLAKLPPREPILLDAHPPSDDKISFQTPVARHHYSAGVVQLFLKIVLSCAASQRAAAAVLDLTGQWLPGVSQTPCANTGRLWLLRLGLYELTREKKQADDWA